MVSRAQTLLLRRDASQAIVSLVFKLLGEISTSASLTSNGEDGLRTEI